MRHKKILMIALSLLFISIFLNNAYTNEAESVDSWKEVPGEVKKEIQTSPQYKALEKMRDLKELQV